jgi:hypothetical protein
MKADAMNAWWAGVPAWIVKVHMELRMIPMERL